MFPTATLLGSVHPQFCSSHLPPHHSLNPFFALLPAPPLCRLVDEMGQPMGPHRVWLQYAWIPGLAMSRALGDVLAHQ